MEHTGEGSDGGVYATTDRGACSTSDTTPSDDQEKNRKRALYSTFVAGLGFVCFSVASTAVGLPLWGHFSYNLAGSAAERGYFGPWKLCKTHHSGAERCGPKTAVFQPKNAVWIAGLMAALGVVSLGIFCIMSVLQLAMVISKDRIVVSYRSALLFKIALALTATLLAMLAAGLFALQTDDAEKSVVVTRGVSFYILLVTIVLDFILFVLGLYDYIFSKKPGGDPTGYHDTDEESSRKHPPAFNNPGYQEVGSGHNRRGSQRGRNGSIRRNGVAVTAASGRPYREPNGIRYEYYDTRSSIAGNGSAPSVLSFGSDSTTVTTVSSVLPPTRGPLRSSLKKPKLPSNADESVESSASGGAFGIQNPGFSGTSPTLSRNGSMKKVRIQTHSTAV